MIPRPTIVPCARAGSASMRRARSSRLLRRPPGSGWLTENFRFAAIQCYKTGLGTGRSVVVDTVLRGRIGFVGPDWPEWDEQQAGSAERTDDGGDSRLHPADYLGRRDRKSTRLNSSH